MNKRLVQMCDELLMDWLNNNDNGFISCPKTFMPYFIPVTKVFEAPINGSSNETSLFKTSESSSIIGS